MNLIKKLEKKFGRYAVNNLVVYILAAYAIGYVLEMFNPTIYSMLLLDPELIFKGQVWRIFTWICTTPQEFGIFIIFMFMFIYWIGSTLERYWGTFRYNFYIISGYLIITIASLLIYLITGLISGFDMAISLSGNTYYINLASFMAFATIFPDMQIYFMMVIPLKIKYLAIIDAIFLGYEFLNALSYLFKQDAVAYALLATTGEIPSHADIYSLIFSNAGIILFSVLNFIIFFFFYKKRGFSINEIKRKNKYKKSIKRDEGNKKHKCAVCGRTEEDGEDMIFRYCSKCEGNYEYCQDHLFTHEHIKR
jgi:hypothetical protein